MRRRSNPKMWPKILNVSRNVVCVSARLIKILVHTFQKRTQKDSKIKVAICLNYLTVLHKNFSFSIKLKFKHWNMKLFFVFIVVIALAAAMPQVTNFVSFLKAFSIITSSSWQCKQERIFIECDIENGISLEQINEFHAEKIKPKDVAEDFRCFQKCCMRQRTSY